MTTQHHARLAAVALSLTGAVAAQTTLDFGSSPAGPITNNELGAGDFEGTEYASLGVVFFAGDARHQLNIGCGVGAGSPANCLGADRATPNDFEGKVWTLFRLGGVRQVTDRIIIDYANPGLPGTRTIVRDAGGGILLNQAEGNVSFFAPGIASVETQFTYDGAETLTFGPLSPAPANFSLGPPIDGCGDAADRLELHVGRAPDVGKIGAAYDLGLRAGPANGVGMFLFGTTDASVYPIELGPLGAPGCWLRNDARVVLKTTFDPTGSTTQVIDTPRLQALVGGSYYVQGLALWPAANAAGLVTSNQLTVRVGG